MSLFRRRLIAQLPIFQYKMLNYVENVNGAYIDTGIASDPKLKFYVKFANWNYLHASGLFGSSSWGNSLAFYYGTMVFCMPNYAYSFACGSDAVLSGELTCTPDGCVGDFEMRKINDHNNTYGNITLFMGGLGLPCKAKIFAYKIWNVDGILVRDFIPVMRKSDDEIGMYDLVNNQFYKSVNDQKFTGE